MAVFHVLADEQDRIAYPAVRTITFADVLASVREGWEDFLDKPSVYLFAAIIYPVVGVFLALWSSGGYGVHLLYPLASGFALIGPFAAIGLYEMSRRKELGLDTSWRHALDVLRSPAIPSLIAVGLWLFALFTAWLGTAEGLYLALFGNVRPANPVALAEMIFGTRAGWALIVYGNLAGLAFAIVTLLTTVIAFPLLIDRDGGAASAIVTSFRAVLVNPLPMLGWGLIVTALLVLGSIPLFVGLIVVMPVLGHATWHLYRRLV